MSLPTYYVITMLYRSIIFAMRMANKIPFTAPTEPFSMSTWALVTIQVLFIAKVAKAMLDPTHPNLHLIMSLLTVLTMLHLIMNRLIITIQSLLTIILNPSITIQNPSIIIRNLPTTITMNQLILEVVLNSPKDLAVDSEQMPF